MTAATMTKGDAIDKLMDVHELCNKQKAGETDYLLADSLADAIINLLRSEK